MAKHLKICRRGIYCTYNPRDFLALGEMSTLGNPAAKMGAREIPRPLEMRNGGKRI
jgi:hypothetical protein